MFVPINYGACLGKVCGTSGQIPARVFQRPVHKVHHLELFNLRMCRRYVTLLFVFGCNNLVTLVVTDNFVDCCSPCIRVVLLVGKVHNVVFTRLFPY